MKNTLKHGLAVVLIFMATLFNTTGYAQAPKETASQDDHPTVVGIVEDIAPESIIKYIDNVLYLSNENGTYSKIDTSLYEFLQYEVSQLDENTFVFRPLWWDTRYFDSENILLEENMCNPDNDKQTYYRKKKSVNLRDMKHPLENWSTTPEQALPELKYKKIKDSSPKNYRSFKKPTKTPSVSGNTLFAKLLYGGCKDRGLNTLFGLLR